MDFWLMLIFPVLLSSGISILLIPWASGIGLLDKPCDRKLHTGNIPLVGGLSVYIAVACVILSVFPIVFDLSVFLISAAFMVFIGLIDDRFDLSVKVRILAQVFAAAILIFGGGINITELGNLLGAGQITLGYLSIPFTLLAIMAAMNAYNMIDGIDGLLGSLSIVAFLGVAILGFLNNQPFPMYVSIVIIGALIPFLIRNIGILPKVRKVFMGDAGSMFIGLSVVWLITILVNPTQAPAIGINRSNDLATIQQVRPVTALWLVAVPLMDMIAIMIRRLIKRQSPFKPDREHLHHIFMRAGFSSREALIFISLVALMLASIGIIFEISGIPESIVLACYVGLFFIYGLTLKNSWKIVSWVRKKRDIENCR